ncbi:spatacsin isoform X1 [Helicoverpa zea]|uniref:spatacsin isoform X1 n=1 Tax=Helicoverpa zea TaxID=7113 RepID=UPI001F56AC2C|nr:spatacsin isoform X1 [Helicoverpa zea]
MEGLTQNEKIIWACWKEKSPRDVVREAAAKGTHIELAITYLKEKNGWNESTAREWFLAEVKAWTVQLLLRKQIFKVLHILNKVKINPELHLMILAQDSAQIEYRDFIVEHLEKLSKDMNTEIIDKWLDFKRHWNLLRYLEKSFEIDGTFKQNKVFGTGKDRIVVNESEIKALTIEKIQKYPPEWKSKIATALFFNSFEFSLLDFSGPLEMWNYLVVNNKAMILVRWINVQTSEVVRDMNARYIFFNNEGFVKKLLNVDTKGFDTHVLESLDEIFRKWPVTNEMVENVAKSNCFAYTQLCIYDTLCSYGIVNESERNNLFLIISRLSRTQNLKLIDDIFTESCSTISRQHFYVELAKYCVKNKLYKVLTLCVEGNILDTDLSDVEKEAKDCIELWLLFKSIEQTSDRQSHVLPVYKTCVQIANENIDDYVSSNPHLVLGMILLEDAKKLFDIFSKEDFLQFKDFKLPNMMYKDKLPHLYNVYKKYTDDNQSYESRDVNVYQLLSGYRGLDVSKIFEFQLVNQNTNSLLNDKPDRRSLGSLLSSDVDVKAASIKALSQRAMEMPDFADEKLMKKYGYVAKLNHVYYLKQYRPCNASQAFVSQQYQTYNRLQDKSVKSACCEAHALALQYWHDGAMTACTVSFIAMIGCNPTRCRVHISAAKMIKNHLMEYKGYSEEKANKTVNEYMSKLIQSNDEAAKEMLQFMEEITLIRISEKQKADGKVDMSLVLYESQTMVKFATLHKLPLPELQLREFVKTNSWFNFLLFGDVFRYPLAQMLQLSQEFEKKSYAEHLKHIMLHRTVDDSAEKDNKVPTSNGQRRVSRLNSVDIGSVLIQSPSPTQGGSFEFPNSAYMGRELWEVAAACHGPEDPPAALLRAADICREPLLVLIASCYEPNAVDVLWPQWILSSLSPSSRSQDVLQQLLTQQHVAAEQFQKVAELCLLEGYVTTLHEAMVIFMPESPLTMFTSFLHRCIRHHYFDGETTKLLTRFLQHAQRKYSVGGSGAPWQLSKDALQKVSVSLVKIALSHNFDSAFHQREFLKCLAVNQFEKGFNVPTPNFSTLYEILKISMETSLAVNISKMLQDDSQQYLEECVQMYTANRNYDVALKIAKLSGVPVNGILIAEWTHKYENLLEKEEMFDDKAITLFIAECSEAFKKAAVTFKDATDFLVSHVNNISDTTQKFYSYRIIMNWFEENLEYGRRREEIEHLMWDAYFKSESQNSIFLNSYQSTLHFIINGQKDANISKKIGMANAEKPFSLRLDEIEIESDVSNIENVVILEEPEAIDNCRRVMNQLLELKLLVDAFRLSALFKNPPEYRYRPPACPVQIVRTCLKLAEGTCSPYELPQELRLVISSPVLQSKLSISGISDASFEELVVIQGEKQENVPESAHLAAREEADRLSALDALAVRSGLTVAKQVASYFRIALQIGWNYTSVLKYQNRAVDFINLVSGRARMSLANLVFKTFNIPSKQVAEYLCKEIVAAIISPHLVKTSAFRQKEHFQYTLWGYALNADIEMFLNMRPDACSHIGKLILDHLMAFQKIYKCTGTSKPPDNTLDDSRLDVETLIDEEYQNVEGDEAESVLTEEGTILSAETESVYSVSTVYTVYSNKMSRDCRRNLFDVINKNNVHIRYEVKSNIRKITKGAKLSTKQVNIICLELLVVAHECFACACDTEGVATTLRSAQALTARLLAARSWRLMVRLLTGLARYTECAYVFQALRDNHQFEFLLGQFDYMLGQQVDKIAEFKQGLLDFLKTHCPGDTDTYIMVALHFNMYAEAASVKRKQAMNLIDDLEKMALDSAKATSKKPFQPPTWLQIHDNVPTRSLLDTALIHCTDAAELYLQGGCTGIAGEMAALAQQIALQISLLNASPTRLILNRSTEQMYRLVSEYLSFMEGLVLLAGRGGEAWRELAYRRALTNDQAYLRDMATYRPDVAHDFLNRYKMERNKTTVSQAAMTELRNLCR